MNNVHVVLLDNVDSFTYNLVDELRSLGVTLTVFRNTVDARVITEFMQQQAKSQPTMLMLSPGPGEPSQAGCMPELLKVVEGKYPVLGICLGHQAIVEHFGGRIVRASTVMHGKSSLLSHCGDHMFAGLPNPFPVARYHSLMAGQLPDGLGLLAEVDDIPMSVYHAQHNMLGFQFHPESILTSMGSQLLQQSVNYLIHQEAQA